MPLTTHLGFTGTRDGCTTQQHLMLAKVLGEMRRQGFTVLHHGDCIGADTEAHLAWNDRDNTIIHPPSNDAMRAFNDAAVIHKPRTYLRRNTDIIADSSVLIAAPKSMRDQRGGTWWTIRKAGDAGKLVYIVRPDGGVEWISPAQRATSRHQDTP